MKKLLCLAFCLTIALSAHAKRGQGPIGEDSPDDGSGSPAIQATLPMPANLTATTTAEGCTNNPGPFITLHGELLLGGLDGRLTFSNNARGTHTHEEDIIVDVTLIPADDPIVFAKQPPEGGVGGNPHIYIQFFDQNWSPVSDAIRLGRCVQGLDPVDLATVIPTDVAMSVDSDSCSNNPGPFITLEGELELGGVNARLIFRNNAIGTHEHEEFVGVDLAIIPAGETIHFAKQPPEGGAGGNPHVFFEFLSGGVSLGDKIYLGRCNKL